MQYIQRTLEAICIVYPLTRGLQKLEESFAFITIFLPPQKKGEAYEIFPLFQISIAKQRKITRVLMYRVIIEPGNTHS